MNKNADVVIPMVVWQHGNWPLLTVKVSPDGTDAWCAHIGEQPEGPAGYGCTIPEALRELAYTLEMQ